MQAAAAQTFVPECRHPPAATPTAPTPTPCPHHSASSQLSWCNQVAGVATVTPSVLEFQLLQLATSY